MSRIFVTGATGLVGSHLLAELVRTGNSVTALKRTSSSLSLAERALSQSPGLAENITWVDGDVTDILSLDRAMAGAEQVYHCAALVSFRHADYGRLMKTNGEGTANVVHAALAAGVKRFCHVSSTAALGRTDEDFPITEETGWKSSSHNTAYAISKFMAECEVWRGMEEGLDAFVVNPSIVLGAGHPDEGSGALFGAVKNGLRFYPTGSNGFVDVRDVAQCMTALMEKGVSSKRFILSAGNFSYREVLSAIASGFGRKAPTVPVNALLSEIAWRAAGTARFLHLSKSMITRETVRNGRRRWLYSNERIMSELGFRFRSLAETVQDTCREWPA